MKTVAINDYDRALSDPSDPETPPVSLFEMACSKHQIRPSHSLHHIPSSTDQVLPQCLQCWRLSLRTRSCPQTLAVSCCYRCRTRVGKCGSLWQEPCIVKRHLCLAHERAQTRRASYQSAARHEGGVQMHVAWSPRYDPYREDRSDHALSH